METFSALLPLCAGNSPVTGEFPSQRPVTRSFGVFIDLCLNKRLSKQSWGWWFETPCSLWRHWNKLRHIPRSLHINLGLHVDDNDYELCINRNKGNFSCVVSSQFIKYWFCSDEESSSYTIYGLLFAELAKQRSMYCQVLELHKTLKCLSTIPVLSACYI